MDVDHCDHFCGKPKRKMYSPKDFIGWFVGFTVCAATTQSTKQNHWVMN